MKRTAYGAFIILGLIWGSNFIFMKWSAVWISPSQIVLLRVFFGFVPLFAFALLSRSLRWQDLRYAHHFVVMAVLATAIYYLAFAKGTALLLSSVAGMLSGSIPLFTFVTAWLFLRDEQLNRLSISGTLLGFAGVFLIARPWNGDVGQVSIPGILWMIGGSLSVGCSFVYARKFISPLKMSPLALTTYQIGLALLLLFLATDQHGITRIFNDFHATAGLVLGLGLFGTGIAYILYYFIVDRLGAVAASGVTYIPPVVALLIGVLWVGEPVTALDLVAVLAILAGVAVLQSGRADRVVHRRVALPIGSGAPKE